MRRIALRCPWFRLSLVSRKRGVASCFPPMAHYLHVTLRTVDLTMRLCRAGGVHPITLSARRHAAACGAGSGGSWGASGGVSELEGIGTFSWRINDSFLTRAEPE